MKKHHIYIPLLFASLILSGCNDWLDVSPKTEIRETTLFSDEEGYRDAVSGVYILLGQTSLYGLNASMYVPEFLAHTWTIPTESADAVAYYLSLNDYGNSDVEDCIDELWSSYYNVIAQINNILENIEESDVTFSDNQKDMITGEMYGLRAFLHLDLLRLFGPVPDEAGESETCIPYVTEMTTDVALLKSTSYSEVKAAILSDLDKAEQLLLDSDPYVTNAEAGDDGDDSEVDLTENEIYRQLHFNYWAVLGTKARYYYWIGDDENAALYALKVIEATDSYGQQIFTLCDEAYYSANSNANLTMKMEHLFGAYNSSLYDEVTSEYFTCSDPLLSQLEEYVATGFESSLFPDDIRNKGTRYWGTSIDDNSSSSSYHFYKYSLKGSAYGMYTVPLLRLSEMYFIVFECETIDNMLPYFSVWRLARGLDSSLDNTLTTTSAVLSRLEKEWRKEFFGEGQMFYFYKKHNYSSFSWPTSYEVPTGGYVVEKPQSQTDYE